jgi:autotransporter-associated beta strand protein
MSFRLSSSPAAGAVLVVLALAASPAPAQTDYYWNAPTGGTGTWDTTLQNWSTTTGGPVDYIWTNSGTERANFGNTAGTVTLGAAITAHGLNFTTDGYIVLGNDLTLAGTGGPVAVGTGTATVDAVLIGTAGLTKTGGGVLSLGGANTYTGVTTVGAGVLFVGSNAALGATGAANNTVVSSGATLRVGGGRTVSEAVTLSGTGVGDAGALQKIGSGNTTWSGVITVGAGGARINSDEGTLNIQPGAGGITGAGQSLTFGGAGNITIGGGVAAIIDLGSGTITKDGTGTLTIANSNNTYTGAVNINGGVLSMPAQNLGTTGLVTLNGGTLQNTNTGTATSLLSATRGISLGAGGGTIDISASATAQVIYDGVISGSGALNKVGPGILAVTNTGNIYTGPTNILAGTLRARTNHNVLPTGTAVTISSGAALDLADRNLQIGSRAGAGAVTINGGTLTVGNATSTTFSGVISGTAGKLTKIGTGTLTLSGANTYTGATTIAAGALQAGAANALPSASAISLNGGTLRTGATTGFTQSVGALSVPTSSTIALGTGAHTLTFASFGTLGAGHTLTITGWEGVPETSGTAGQIIFTNTAGLTPAVLANITFTGNPLFGTGAMLVGNELVPVPVPEPAAVLGLAAAGLGLAQLVRRRAKREVVVS